MGSKNTLGEAPSAFTNTASSINIPGNPGEFTYAAEKSTPSVVHIKTKMEQRSRQQFSSPLDDLFGGFGDPFGGGGGGGSPNNNTPITINPFIQIFSSDNYNPAQNDVFTITDVQSCGFTSSVQIFNRWGKIVFESNNYQNDWNGTAHSSSVGSSDKVPTGTYYYIVNLKNSGLKPFSGPIYVGTK